MNRKISGILACMLLIAVAALPAMGTMDKAFLKERKMVNTQPIPGIYFYQVDYKWEKSTYINSNTGKIVVDIEKVKKTTGLQSGYINVYSAQGWIIQNLAILENFPYPSISRFFDLGQAGEVTSIDVHVEATTEPYSAFAYSGALSPYPVSDTTFNAEGADEIGAIMRPQPPPANVPGEDDFDDFGHTFFYTQDKHPNVATAKNQCVPTAYANNLQYLKNVFGTELPHELVPGVNGNPSNSLPARFDVLMERESVSFISGSGTNYENALEGFLQYVFFESTLISVKHQGLMGNQDVAFDEAISKGQGSTVSFDFLLNEMKEGHAVTLLYWRYAYGEHISGHMVQLVTAGYIMGVPFIIFLDDSPQGGAEVATDRFFQTYLWDYDIDGKYNGVNLGWTWDGPPEVELLVVMVADNQPPEKPSMPSGGEWIMETGVEYEFTTSTIDPNGHPVWYFFDWGDGIASGWIGPYDSGKIATASHSWSADGLYIIKAKARDMFDAESEWSDERWGIVPKIYQYQLWSLIEKLFDWLQQMFGREILTI